MPVRVFVSGWNRTYVPGSSPSIFIQLWMTCPVSWRASCFRVCHNSPSLNWKVKIQKCLVKAADFLVLVLRKIKKDYLLKLTGKFHACNFFCAIPCNFSRLWSSTALWFLIFSMMYSNATMSAKNDTIIKINNFDLKIKL